MKEGIGTSNSRCIITLLTDFGAGSYVAQMKGIILSVTSEASIVDLCHEIPPQDIVAGSLVLADTTTWFPPGTIHIAVVDPGVGSNRELVYAEVGEWRYVLPDNGLLGPLLEEWPLKRAIKLTNQEFWQPSVSKTFHGRDILAPVAAHLSRGVDPLRFGSLCQELVGSRVPKLEAIENGFQGEIVAIDAFGNLITNVKSKHFEGQVDSAFFDVKLFGKSIHLQWVNTYSQQNSGTFVALFGSSGRLEIAQVEGNAARTLEIGLGHRISIVRVL